MAAAQAKATNGDLKNTQLMYAEAAAYFGETAALLHAIDAPIPQAAYLNQEGFAWLKAGEYPRAQPPLEHALVLREKALDAEHPDLATSLNNLAGLYRVQGQYAQATPLYQTRYPNIPAFGRQVDAWSNG